MPQKVILDTDIGDDIDDAYALALILASDEFDLVGVTTVFGNTAARARQAQTILKLAGRQDVPVAAGCGATLSPRPGVGEPDLPGGQVSLTARSRDLLDDIRPRQDVAALTAAELPALSAMHGVDFLIGAIMDGDGDVIPVTIGAMTNLAMALVKEPRIASRIPRIVSMAGCYFGPAAEWNVRCDPVAAAIVFGSGVPVTAVGLDVTTRCVIAEARLARLAACERPVAQNLARATEAWAGRLPCLHDPLAVETVFRPDLVAMKTGTVTVELEGAVTYARTVFEERASGPHSVGAEVNSAEAVDLWLDRVVSL